MPFIGRDKEIALVREELLRPEVRLLTLTGPPGIGKTRLAIAVATDVRDRFEDGVWFVDLASIADSALVVPAIAHVLRIREAAPQALLKLVKRDLRDKHNLLVLDNFEQVTGAAVELADLLEACPAVKMMVTSRAALRLSWEHEFPVPPLGVPDPAHLPGADIMSEYPAIALFVERARAVSPSFRLTASTAEAVARVCARLDGLPLAIELAAARIKELPPPAILTRLESRLDFLTGGTRDLPARQQTLRRAIAWSYDLLDPTEKTWFNRLSGFMGGCPSDGIEAVCTADAQDRADTLDILRSLIDKSLLQQEAGGAAQPRFRMLETIQEFGLDRLRATGEFEAVRERHAAFFITVAERAEVGLATAAQPAWLDWLEREHDNLRAALRWALGRAEAQTALRLVATLMRFWLMKAYYAEARMWAERVLAATADATLIRAKTLRGFAHLLWIQGDYERAKQLSEQSLTLSQDLGDRYGIAFGVASLGLHAYLKGDLEEAAQCLDRSLRLARELQDKWLVSLVLNILGRTVDRRGDPALARQHLDEGLRLADGIGDRWLVSLLHTSLGVVSLHQRDAVPAAKHFNDSLGLARDLGDQWGIAWNLEGLAAVAVTAGDHERAARLLGAADALRKVINTPLTPSERADLERTLAAARAALSEADIAAAWAKGAAMRPDQAIQYAVGVGESVTTEAKGPASLHRLPGTLSLREQQVAALIARGKTSRQIARALFIAERTAETHVQHILNKLGVNSRAQIAVWAVEHGLLTSDGNAE
ncbi:MAG TPA: LuxR C-terminal-related transcriptional regulator [bacterium]|nr:LuxR C-terminal-related transcriptional regulator [bacterium]